MFVGKLIGLFNLLNVQTHMSVYATVTSGSRSGTMIHNMKYINGFMSKPRNSFFAKTDFIAALDRFNHSAQYVKTSYKSIN